MRKLYTFLFYFTLPFIIGYLYWRGRKAPLYRQRIRERFGFYSELRLQDSIWIHAVSVGEFLAAVPLINFLLKKYPQFPLIVTTTTPTGSERVRTIFADKVKHVYVPYDFPFAVKRFLKMTRPQLAIFIETELWPNMLYLCAKASIPTVIASARLSARSAEMYHYIRWIMRDMFSHITLLAAQTTTDAQRFQQLGMPAERITVMGNLKFDIELAADLSERGQALRQVLGAERPVWIAASTHHGEDELVLQAFAKLRQYFPDLLLLLVPRHPERFSAVSKLCKAQGYTVTLRSDQKNKINSDIFLGDTMGELPLFYAASDVAFVGGSLVATGGHNLLEPATLGIPMITGPHMFNFAEINRIFQVANAARQVNNVDELTQELLRLFNDQQLRQQMITNGKALMASNQGALNKLLEEIDL